MDKIKRFFLHLVPSIVILLVPIMSLADGGSTVSIPNPIGSSNLTQLFDRIANYFGLIMVPIAVIMILYAAFLLITAGGEDKKTSQAKRLITWAVVGIAIALIAKGIPLVIANFLGAH